MLALNFKADLKPIHRALIDLHAKQIPFAVALAATRLAKGVQAAEADEIERTFAKATPFTKNAIAVQPATKSKPIALVFPKDIQEAYLEPYIVGGNRSLGGKKAMLVPIGAKVNAFGNLSRGQLAALKARPDVFIGTVKFKRSGKTVSGVWQRGAVKRGTRRAGDYGTRGDSQGKVAGQRSTLKLLIEFEDTTPVPKRLDFYGRGQRYVRANAQREFTAALNQALATARK